MSLLRKPQKSLYYPAKQTVVTANEAVPGILAPSNADLGVPTHRNSTFSVSVYANGASPYNVIILGLMAGKTLAWWSRARNAAFLGITDNTFTESLYCENFDRMTAIITGVGAFPPAGVWKLERAI